MRMQLPDKYKDLPETDYIIKKDREGGEYAVWAPDNSQGKQAMAYLTRPPVATKAAAEALSRKLGTDVSLDDGEVLAAMRQVQHRKARRRKEEQQLAIAAGFMAGSGAEDERAAWFKHAVRAARAIESEDDANKMLDALYKVARLTGTVEGDGAKVVNVGSVELVVPEERAADASRLLDSVEATYTELEQGDSDGYTDA